MLRKEQADLTQKLNVKADGFTQQEGLLCPGNRVLVAVSGGADSVALLHWLYAAGERLSLAGLAAAHLHHGLRGEEADRDEAFVRRLCDTIGVPLYVRHEDVAACARQTGEGLEEAGRRLRYAFFAQIAEAEGFDRIATAHTLSDNVETLLLHMTRGCGMQGLCGIAPQRGRLIRPLLTCTRDEVEAYCRAHGLSFVTDSTNADVTYARNRVRDRVVPELERINPRMAQAFGRLIRQAQTDAAYWRDIVQRDLQAAKHPDGGYRLSVLRTLPEAERMRVLRAVAAENRCGECGEEALRRLDALLTAGGECTLPGGVRAQSRAARDRLTLSLASPPEETAVDMPVVLGKEMTFLQKSYRADVLLAKDHRARLNVHKNLSNSAFDYDKIVGELHLRTRLPGDAYHPAGRRVGKSLKKLFNEARVGEAERFCWPILCDAAGIVLVPGFGCDERVRPDGTTERVLVFGEAEDRC